MKYNYNSREMVNLKPEENVEFYEKTWVKHLMGRTKTNCDICEGILSFYYDNEKEAQRAKQICMNRNILTTKLSPQFNKLEMSYRIDIVCQPTQDDIVPKSTHPCIEPILD